MKIFRYRPENRERFSFMYPTWDAAVDASREIMQSEFGKPAIYRISDPGNRPGIETLRHAGPGGHVAQLARLQTHAALSVSGQCGGRPGLHKTGGAENQGGCPKVRCDFPDRLRGAEMGAHPLHGTLHARGLGDYDILIDTLEAAVTWDNLHRVHQGVRACVEPSRHHVPDARFALLSAGNESLFHFLSFT